MIRSDWHGCYRDSWQGLIVPDAFAHPAKFSRGLIRRIYDHMHEEDWLKPGDTVLDPFGGVALGALDAMRLGCEWIGVELEEKFVTFGVQNITLWNARFSSLPNWGTAVILQGDSRKLLTWNFAGPKVEACVGSPPYAESPVQGGGANAYGAKKQFDQTGIWPKGNLARTAKAAEGYGTSPANLGNLPDRGFEAVVGSPPYAHGTVNRWSGDKPEEVIRQWYEGYRAQGGGMSYEKFAESVRSGRRVGMSDYGTTDGQLGQMPEGCRAVVSSPPYEGSLDAKGDGIDWTKAQRGGHSPELGTPRSLSRGAIADGYGAGPDNLGNSSGDTFWSASRQILEQAFLAVRPGGHAVWVVKRFCRDGRIVDFSGQWAKLCVAVGFELLHWHKASLVEDRGTQEAIDGNPTRLVTQRKSFFRRLHEKKRPGLSIDWEDVLCFLKPSR